MSHRATNWAFEQRCLKPSAKIVLLVLADCHNPANGCFPTQAFLADACEMNRDTVNVQLALLEERGLIRRVRSIDPVSKRQRPTRYKLAFEADFGGDEGDDTLPAPCRPRPHSGANSVSEIPTQTPQAVSEIPAEPCRKYGESRVGNSDTNPVKEPVTEPCAGGAAAHSLAGFEDFWEAHPRPRDRNRAEKLFANAVAGGVRSEAIIQAAERYRAENAGNKPQYVAYADNWLEQRRWEDYRDAQQIVASSSTIQDAAAFWAAKVKAGKYIPQNAFGAEIAACMIRSGLLQQQDLLRAGVRF